MEMAFQPEATAYQYFGHYLSERGSHMRPRTG
jgi:hypothetical protein